MDDRVPGHGGPNTVMIPPSFTDQKTGAVWAHTDYVPVIKPFEFEGHIGPIVQVEPFADIKSFTTYVKEFGPKAFVTWNNVGLAAVLDYHGRDGTPGRCKWAAVCRFVDTPQAVAWNGFFQATVTQAEFIEQIENNAGDIADPAPTMLMGILRALRGHSNNTASIELKPGGGTVVQFSQAKGVTGPNDVVIPDTFTVAIPLVQGHVDETGKPIAYAIPVRIRPDVNKDGLPHFRLEAPTLPRIREAVTLSLIEEAKKELTGYTLFRVVA